MFQVILIIAVVLICIVVAILALAATKSSVFRVQRSLSITAPPDKIFPHINDFHRWAAWSPFEKLDPGMKKTFSGADNGTGAVYEWEGNSKAGKGRMEISESARPGKIIIQLYFEKPFKNHNVAEFTMVPTGGTTKVTWAMQGPNLFMGKVMSIFINMDSMIGKHFEEGLANLKAITER